MNQQGPIQTTEWSDIQYKFGNKVGKYADPELEQKILEQRLKQTVDDFVENFNPNDYKTLEEVEAELEESYDDDRELERLRAQRIAEMQQQAQAPSFGVVRRIEKSDYVAQVNNAGDGIPVVLLLMLPQHHDCLRLKRSFEEIAAKHMGTKFLEIISTECIPNFPERQLPCVIIYKDGSLVKQLTGLNSWGGEKFTTDDVLYELHKMGVVNDADVAADLQDKDAQQEPNLKSWGIRTNPI